MRVWVCHQWVLASLVGDTKFLEHFLENLCPCPHKRYEWVPPAASTCRTQADMFYSLFWVYFYSEEWFTFRNLNGCPIVWSFKYVLVMLEHPSTISLENINGNFIAWNRPIMTTLAAKYLLILMSLLMRAVSMGQGFKQYFETPHHHFSI